METVVNVLLPHGVAQQYMETVVKVLLPHGVAQQYMKTVVKVLLPHGPSGVQWNAAHGWLLSSL